MNWCIKDIPEVMLDMPLKDDDSPHGGTSYAGETLRDFIGSADLTPETTLDELEAALHDCGIKSPLKPMQGKPDTADVSRNLSKLPLHDITQRSGDFSVELDYNLSDLQKETATPDPTPGYQFNWDGFSATDFVNFCAKAENGQIEDGEYVGCVRVGELCFDSVVRSTYIEGRLVLDYDLYIGGVDSGYGYTKDGYPYDEGGGGSFGSLCIDMTYDDFKSHAEQVLGGFIHKENRKEKAMAPLRLW